MAETPRAGESDVHKDSPLLDDRTLQSTTDISAQDDNKVTNGVAKVTNDEGLVESARQKLHNVEEKLDDYGLTVDSSGEKVDNYGQKIDGAEQKIANDGRKVDSARENVQSETGLEGKSISSEQNQEKEIPEPVSREASSANSQTGQGLETAEQDEQEIFSSEQTSLADSDHDKVTEPWERQSDSTQPEGTEVRDRLSISRQDDYEDAVSSVSELKDVPSMDGDSIQMMDIHRSTGTIQCCSVKTICDEAIDAVPIVVEEVRIKDGDANTDNTVTEDRAQNTMEISLEQIEDCTNQIQSEEHLGKTSEQTRPEDAFDEVLYDQQEELKAQIKALQEKLEIVIKENQEKSMKIVTLEGQLLEMTEKLRDTERRVSTTETSQSRPDITKSKTCSVL